MKSIYRHICFLLIVLSYVSDVCAQREINNIYLFDCTGSMKGNGLWDPAKEALFATISAQKEIAGSQFHVIPFGDIPFDTIAFDSAGYSGNIRSSIEKAFDACMAKANFTRVSDALNTGFRLTDPNKDNKIYLLTDGLPNGGDSPSKVAGVISSWCTSHRNSRLFYVALKDGVIDHTIQDAIDRCPDAFIVQCVDKVIPQVADISSDIYTNIQELDAPKTISFSIPGKYEIASETTDSLFDVHVRNNVAENGKIQISLRPKAGLETARLHQILQGQEYSFPLQLQCVDRKFFIANPSVAIHVSDEVQSGLTLCQSVEKPGTEWYDTFLWNDSAPDKKIAWDLTPVFKNELSDSGLTLRLESDGDDFQAWFNGSPLAHGVAMRIIPGQDAVLEILFDHDASEGKRYFSLVPISTCSIDLINDSPADDYTGTTLRTSYNVVWNPLKIVFVWLCVILTAILLLWLLFVRRLVYPTIKLSSVTILGPDSYFAQKRIRGARKIVLTSKHRSQNFISRIFTGEIRYIRSGFFASDISIVPSGGKKKVRVRPEGTSGGNWSISPSAVFGPFSGGQIINLISNQKAQIDFSN